MNRLERVILVGFLIATLALIWSSDPPPMYDVSSHLASAVIVHELAAGDPFFAQHWAVHAAPIPYWFTSLALQPLLGAVAPMTAVRILLSLYALALPLAFWSLLRTVRGGSMAIVLLGTLTVFNWAYWLGETNFLFGQPLAILTIALYRRIERVASPAFVGFLGVAALTYLCHIFALCEALGAIALLALFAFIGNRVPAVAGERWNLARGLALAWMAFLFALAAYFVLYQHGTGNNQGEFLFDFAPLRLGNIFRKPLGSPTLTSPLPILALVAVLSAVWASPRWKELVRRPWNALREGLDIPLFLIGIAFALLMWLGPESLHEAGGRNEEDIGPRFRMIAFVFMVAALRLPRGRWPHGVFLAALLAFSVLRYSDAWALHRDQAEVYSEIRAEVFAEIPPQSSVLPILDERGPDPRKNTYFRLYAGNYLVIERHCYVASIFARTGQQPLRHLARDEHRSIYVPKVAPEEWAEFDWILVQSVEETPRIPGLEEHGELVASAQGFFLYRPR